MVFTKKGDDAVLDKIAKAPAPHGELGQRLHRIVRDAAPDLEPVVRWGLAFYVKDGEDVCYIKPDKDYLVFGFSEKINPAREDGASMHPVAWSITDLDDATESRIRELVTTAVS